MCVSGTVDIQSIIVFVSINIVSTRGKCDVYLSTVGIQNDKGFILNNILSTFVSVVCVLGTVDTMAIKTFYHLIAIVSINIVSTLGQCGVHLR